MASQAQSGPTPTAAVTKSRPTPEDMADEFEQGLALLLSFWPPLVTAVQNNWGGGDSADKRDWLGGVLLDEFQTRSNVDKDYIEDLLLQVMEDEFYVVLEDDSEAQLAGELCALWRETGRGEFERVRALEERDRVRREKGGQSAVQAMEEGSDEDEDSEDGEDEDGDIDMDDAPALVPKAKVEPEVDEDGFTKVVGKKKR
ncbi:pre-rRNA-processing protein TSR2 [Aulographum hederae CBS 113979]|uniref:Pre-rRNA-processing protein TSR2 n=1 Tax=Aulographum hederae CBS 113979 TaxID=1176131 RepID=A0A6G1GKP7_9PEZI|nr:pre-rRNA-processing protein TSR2 [Aulographum hederae CBS 113979]